MATMPASSMTAASHIHSVVIQKFAANWWSAPEGPATIRLWSQSCRRGPATKLFEDKTPNAIILNRILLNSLNVAAHDDLVDADGRDLIDLIVLLSRKLLSVWTHLQAYQEHETALAEQAASWPTTKREHSQELYEEFDVFSVQIKSTLDHLVQIMRPILGRNKWTMYSFRGERGAVLASLQRNTSKHHAGHVRMMEHHLFGEKNRGWLAMIIEARDQVNHGMAGGMKIERFAVYRDADGAVHLPCGTVSSGLRPPWGSPGRTCSLR